MEEPQEQTNELNDSQDDFNNNQPMVEPDTDISDNQSFDNKSQVDSGHLSGMDDVNTSQEASEAVGEDLSEEPTMSNLADSETPIDKSSNFDIQENADATVSGVGMVEGDVLPDNQAVVPVVAATVEPQAPGVIEKKKPRFSKKLIGLVIAGAIVLISGASAFAAYSWYQAPQKVLTDSLFNAIKAKSVTYTGNISYSGGGYELSLSVNGKNAKSDGSVDIDASIKVSGKEYKVLASGMIVSNGDLFFKVGGLDSLAVQLKSALGEYGDYYSVSIDKLVAKINDKWIKVSNSDVASYSKEYSDAQKCINTTIDKYMDDSKALDEVFNVYNKNKFIVINKELGQKDGSYGYEIKGDKEALTPFIDGLKGTTIYKSLKDCDSSFDITPSDFGVDSSSSSDTTTSTLEVWVNSWSHQITKVSASGKDSSDTSSLSVSISPIFDKEVSVKAPSDFLTIDELKTFITDLLSA